jgi:hypothetical protein
MVMKTKGIEKMMSTLTKKGVHVCGTTDEFYGIKGDNNGIWIAADSNPELFDYYSEVWNDTFGVDSYLHAMVEGSGWYFEWHDPGTMMVWPL